MGIIETQTTKNTIYSYLGAALGFITIIVQSHLFSTDENGLLRILVSVSMLFAQISNLGFSTVTIKFFPYFKNEENGNHGFLFYAMIIPVIGFILCWIGFNFFEAQIIEDNIQKSRLIVDYLFYILPLTFFTLYFFVFDAYLRAIYSSVIGTLSKDVLQRIIILIVILFYFLQLISFSQFVFCYALATCLPTIILLFQIIKLDEFKIKPQKGKIHKSTYTQMMSLALFSMVSTFSGAIILSIDVLMVNSKLGLAQTGIYSIAFYFGSILLIPARSMGRIVSSIIAKHFQENNLHEIAQLYIKTSNSLLTIGLFLFLGIAVNIDNIMQILPAEYVSGKYVIIILGIGYLFEIGTGINQWIILNSKHYFFDTLFVMLSLILIVYLNHKLIPIYGISGSAIATAGNVILLNVLRYIFILWKYGMQPFNVNSVKIITIFFITFFVGILVPQFDYFITDIFFRSSIISLIFIGLIIKFNAAPDINQKIHSYITTLLK